MADTKKPQPFPLKQPPPPNRPVGTITLEPGEEPPEEPYTLTSPPSGNQPPPKKPGARITAGMPGNEAQLYGGPRDGEETTIAVAQKYLQQGFGYIELPSKKVFTATPQPGATGQQPPYKPGEKWTQIPFGPDRGKWVTETEYVQKYGPIPQTQKQPVITPTVGVKTKLAQPIEPPPSAPRPMTPYEEYSKRDRERIASWQKIEESTSGRMKREAEKYKAMAEQEAKKNAEEKYAIPIEKLSIVKKMVSEFRNFYYQGYADAIREARRYAGQDAAFAEYRQKQAIQYGMSSLTDLHRGLDLASWNFFFKILGPLGSIFENYHEHKIGWDMAYYGRAWWSPYRIDYLIKTLPEEKAFDLVYGALKNSIYLINKIGGSPLFSRVTTYDRFGRKIGRDHVVFTPLHKLQGGLNTISAFTDVLTTERSINKIQTELSRALETQPKNFTLHRALRQKLINTAAEVNKNWLVAPLEIFSRDKDKRKRAREILLARLGRTVGLKSISRNISHTERDPLSYLAILIAEWIFDVTVGNVSRIIVEKLASSSWGIKLQEFFSQSEKYMTAGRMTTGALSNAGRAIFSINTIGGGLIGYQLGGIPGAMLGTSGGWFWQTILNFANDATRMNWVSLYEDFLNRSNYLNGLKGSIPENYWQGLKEELDARFETKYIRGLQFENPETTYKLFNLEWKIGKFAIRPFSWMFTPGPISRFAYFLQNGGEWKILGKQMLWNGSKIIIPEQITGLFRAIPSTFINGTLVRWYVSPFLTEIGKQLGWDSNIINFINTPVFQYGLPYLWETRPLWTNLLSNYVFKPLFGNTWNWLRFSEMGATEAMGEFDALIRTPSLIQGVGPGVGYLPETGTILLQPEEGFGQVAQARGWYRGYLNFRIDLAEKINTFFNRPFTAWLEQHKTIANFLSRYQTSFSKFGLTNFAGFIVGFEVVSLLTGGNLIAAFLGGAVGFFTANLVLETIGTLLGKFGLNFVPLFNAGFWLTTIGQTILGFMGYTLPNIWLIPASLWAPVTGGFLFALSPLWLTYLVAPVANFLVAGTGAFVTTFAAGLGSSIVGLTPLIVSGTIAVVAVTAVFAIIIIGSAFWVPISENLKGLTATSPCFDISSPTFTDINNNNSNAIFTNGETKTVCWTTTNKQEFYQDAIIKTKGWSPGTNFTMEKYNVTIITPDGQKVVWDNVSGKDKTGNYNLTESHDPPTLLAGGVNFSLTPPQNTALATQQAAQQIRQIYDQLNSSTNPSTKDELVVGAVLPTLIAWDNSNYLQAAELNYLNAYLNNPKTAINSETTILNDLKTANTGGDVVYRSIHGNLPGNGSFNGALYNVIYNCDQWQQKINAVPAPSPLPTAPYSSCDTLMKSLGDINSSGPGGNSPYQQMQNFFNEVKSSPASALLLKKDDLSNQPSQLSKSIQSLNGYPSYIDKIKNINPSLTGTALDDAINNLAGQTIQNQGNYYLPIGSTITVCLTLKYNGENGKVANIIEKDAANLPFLGPLSVPSCQAQLITPINAVGPGNLQWPTDNRSVSGYSYDQHIPSPDNKSLFHKGIDLGGTPGSPVKSAGSGTIIQESYEQNGFGYYAIVRGDDGNYYIYSHLGENGFTDSSAFTSASGVTYRGVGATIAAGETIGNLGSSGNASGPHLHFGVSTQPDVSSFYNTSTTTLSPCGFLQGGCP